MTSKAQTKKRKGNWNTSEKITHRTEESICKSYNVSGEGLI